MFKERYNKLNAEQKRAVDAIEGPVLVVAGPGSGKTELLGLRVANILDKSDVYPNNILCLTFTDSAAVNMRKRLEGLIGPDAYRVAIHTFHSFGTEVINHHPEFFYQGASFSSADDLLQIEVITTLLEELPHDNPLRSFHPEQGYVYVQPIRSAFSALKKSGLTPSEFENIISHNAESLQDIAAQVHEVFEERLSKDSFGKVSNLVSNMRAVGNNFPITHFASLTESLADSLNEALKESEELGKTTPLSAWKTKHTKKGDTRILSEQYYLPHMQTLVDLYAAYQKNMHERGFFDFDDMLLDAIQGIENNEVLKSELQEQYQYVLVDEFQDTNDAQMRLINVLTNNPVYEGRPNVMVVGDDDQAIFKFQGAELSNILGFKDAYEKPEVVTLIKNYRSTQDVLNISRNVILQGKQRLENILPEIEKELIAANDSLTEGSIHDKRFATVVHERQFVADHIEESLKQGTEPSEIAVIARRHKDLQALVPLLHLRRIPVNYEQQQNIFNETHIHQLITMCRFVASLARKEQQEADDLLPEILAYPFWNLDRVEVMKLSVDASARGCTCKEGEKCTESRLWLHYMLRSKNEDIKNIAEFFVELGARAQSEPMEYVLNSLIGATEHMQPEFDEHGDLEETLQSESPFKAYYFSEQNLKDNTAEYVQFLASLQTFIGALREYKKGVRLTIDDLVEFVDLHETNDLRLLNTSPFVNSTNAVSLLSAHKAKGLEFDTVFVLSCQESIWAGKGRRGLLPFPANLPITPSGDDRDDQLRLFYVALTRAKRHLYITSYETEASGKESLKVPFVSLDNSNIEKGDVAEDASIIAHAWETKYIPPFVPDEKAILEPLVEEYKMSVTHLNNYLNVERGGPQAFLENNLLRFPQPKSPAGSYGTAMHATIARLYTDLKSNGTLASLPSVLEWFDYEMNYQRLSDSDTRFYATKGIAALTAYYNTQLEHFDPAHEIEIDFAKQGVIVEGATLSGKIDKIVKHETEKTIHVGDFKTGKAEPKWSESSGKLVSYRRQLLFYKLLIEHSRSYDTYKVESGTLEFLEPKGDTIVMLDLQMLAPEVDRLKQLIGIVYKKILNLDFPDTSEYSPDAKGMRAFEEDLLSGT